MRSQSKHSNAIFHLVSFVVVFSVAVLAIQSTFFTGGKKQVEVVSKEEVVILSRFQKSVQQCVGSKSCAVTTLGRGGSDLTATTIGKALGLREVQVWKGVDGVLTCDPNIFSSAQPVPYLTFEEAAELAYFGAQVLHPQSMRPAKDSGVPVRVKNSYNPNAPGTLINQERDMTKAILTSIVVKRNVTMLDIVSTRMLGSYGFLAKVFSIFQDLEISIDMIATSEVSISLTLDTAKPWSRELIQQELDQLSKKLEEVAVVNMVQNRAIISLIENVQKSSLILEKVFRIFPSNGINVQMISQGASKECRGWCDVRDRFEGEV